MDRTTAPGPADCGPQGLAGSTWVLRSSGAASGEIMNLIISRAASCSFETVNTRDARRARLVQEARQWPDILGSRYADHDVGLLNADLEVAARQIVGDGTAGGERGLGLQLLGQAELRNPLPDIRAAAAARIADRLRREQRRLVGFHRADVGFRRASPHRKAETGEHERRHRAGHDLAILDECLNRGRDFR